MTLDTVVARVSYKLDRVDGAGGVVAAQTTSTNHDPHGSARLCSSHSIVDSSLSRRTCPDQMPPWVASAPRSITGSRVRAIDRCASFSRCRYVANPPVANFRVRRASTHISPTAINYRPNVPPRNEELYDALSGLSGAAEQYVNLSRLQLALRGLAVENAVTRIAVLGLDSQVSAQRLAKLLIADPLAEKGKWEDDLEKTPEEGALLLRYEDLLLLWMTRGQFVDYMQVWRRK